MDEEALDFKFLPAGGNFTCAAATRRLPRMAAWNHFLQHCGVITELARCHLPPLPRAGSNATPVAAILMEASEAWETGKTYLNLTPQNRIPNTLNHQQTAA